MKKPTRAENFDLASLLDGIDSGTVVLPNFQRDFDWTVADIRSLIGTVLRGWPLGSLLLIEGDADRDFYDPRPFADAPSPAATVDLIVLDGQQRLTALYHAMRGRGKFKYAVRIDQPLTSIDDVDKAVVAIKDQAWKASPREQFASGYLPVTALESAEAFYEWRDKAVDLTDQMTTSALTEKYRIFLSGMNQYRVPAVLIGTSVGPEAVARIFERVNRTGMKLGAFDLMVAKSFTPSFNLRSLWDEAQKRNEALKHFLGGDGLPILITLALRLRGDVRQSAVLDLAGTAIQDGWPVALSNLEMAVDFLSKQLGVLDPAWLPYRSMLPVLAAINFDVPLSENRKLIERWYWSTAVGRRYDEGSNTTAVADFKMLRNGIDPISDAPYVVRELALESTRGQQGAFHRTFLNALGRSVLHSAGEELQPELVRAASVFERDAHPRLDPPLHLRSLGFYLGQIDSKSVHMLPGETQFGDVSRDDDVQTGLVARLEAFVGAVSQWIGEKIPIVSSTEIQEIEIFFGGDEET